MSHSSKKFAPTIDAELQEKLSSLPSIRQRILYLRRNTKYTKATIARILSIRYQWCYNTLSQTNELADAVDSIE